MKCNKYDEIRKSSEEKEIECPNIGHSRNKIYFNKIIFLDSTNFDVLMV